LDVLEEPHVVVAMTVISTSVGDVGHAVVKVAVLLPVCKKTPSG
jgi:hypothetical protein